MWPIFDITVDSTMPWLQIYYKHVAEQQQISLAQQSIIEINEILMPTLVSRIVCCSISGVAAAWVEGKKAERALIKMFHILIVQPSVSQLVLLWSIIFGSVQRHWQLMNNDVAVMWACRVGGKSHEFWSDCSHSCHILRPPT